MYFRLHPTGQLFDDLILQNVTEWAFQVLPPAQVPDSDGDPSELSLAETGATERFVEVLDAVIKKHVTVEEPGGDEGEEETEESQTESDDGRREERSERTRENDSKEVRKRMMEVITPFWLGMPPWMRGEYL